MKLFVLSVCLVFILKNSNAQFNDSTFYFFRYVATGIASRTNDASNYTISNALRFSIKKKRLTLNSNANWVYGQQEKRLVNNDFFSAIDVNYYRPLRKFYYWGLVTYESSYSLKVNNRTQLGLGAAYSVVDDKDFFVNFSDGILYEFADLKLTDSTKDIYSTFRNSFRFRFRYVYKDRLTLETVSFLQNSLQEKSDYIINTNTSISFKLVKWISLTSAIKYNRVNRNKRDNLLLTFGLTAEKYF